MTFYLHPNLLSKIFFTDWPLCRVLMEDEKHYPWFFLVPRRPKVSKLIDLSSEDQLQLLKEMDCLQKIVCEEFDPDQLNVAAIGNKTPQLHIHIIGRFKNDPAWPNTVWDHPIRSKYDEDQKNQIISRMEKRLRKDFTQCIE